MNSEMALAERETAQVESEVDTGIFDRLAQMNRKGLAQTSAMNLAASLEECKNQTCGACIHCSFIRAKRKIAATGMGILRNAEDASDAAHEAYLAGVSMSRDGVVPEKGSWDNWLIGATRNQALLILRSRRQVEPLDGTEAMLRLTVASGEAQATAAVFAEWLNGKCTSERDKALLLALSHCKSNVEAAAQVGITVQWLRLEIIRLRAKFGVVPVVRRGKTVVQTATGITGSSGVCRVGSTKHFGVAPVRTEAEAAMYEVWGPQWDWTEVAGMALHEWRKDGPVSVQDWGSE